jgi:F-type H+-transporting ATPase subunit b
MTEIRQKFGRAGMLLLLLASALLVIPAVAQSQDKSSSSSPERSASRDPNQPRGMAGQLAKETREAANEGDEQGQFKHSTSVQWIAGLTGLSLERAYWLCVVINFAVIAGVVYWFSRTRLPGMFRDRTAAIQKAMQEAQKASAEANQRLTEIEARLSKLDAEIGNMRGAAEKEASAEEDRIQAAAAEEASKIVAAAGEEIAAAGLAARRELSAHAANLAVSLASKQIHVDSATDQALVSSFASQLPAEPNGKPTRKTGENGD